MKYIDEFRDGQLARGLSNAIAQEAKAKPLYRFMEFCGGHTHCISRHGLSDLLPSNVQLIHGPGCPVCVLPIGRLDMAIDLALNQGVTLCTYGDALRVPASKGLSLLKAKAQGADVRMVYSPADALKLARTHPELKVVFLAIGFETTAPATAVVLSDAAQTQTPNFSVLCNHVLTPSAMQAIVDGADRGETAQIDGFIGPAHVSIIIGTQAYEPFARLHRKPVVIAGFEPLDVLQAIAMLIRQINQGRSEVENEFIRAVDSEGNRKAKDWLNDVFELRDEFEWRGLGTISRSALRIKAPFLNWDAEHCFDLKAKSVKDHKACECGAILRGVKQPRDCAIFGTVCTPEQPVGSCMVSSEGACAAHYQYGRFRIASA